MSSIAVVGAGAAGIAAARMLHDAGRDVLLIEARSSIGGRASTWTGGGLRLDLGCGWLHSARRNPWTEIARARGFDIRTDTANWDSQWRDLGFSPAEQRASAAAWERWYAAALAERRGPDRPLSDFVATDDPWHPMLDAISGYVNGAPLDRVSLHDWAEYEEAASDDNWAVLEGYGTLIAGHAKDVPVRVSTPVERIDHSGLSIRLATRAGTIDADQVIVAVPTSMLASGAIVFDPPLHDKQAAADALPLGLADKIFLRTDRVDWSPNAHLTGNPHNARTASYRLSPFGMPMIEGFYGGTCAEELTEADAAAFAIDELAGLLGNDWRKRLHPILTTRWRREPWIAGSYSHARVGYAGARAILAGPVDDRLFFAGEACSTADFSTAHGAYATGVAAARAILER